mgnify:CR=1 FL=1
MKKERRHKAPYSRVRDRTSVRSVHLKRRQKLSDGSTLQLDGGSSVIGVFERCVDVVTPGFAAISKAGGLVNNPFLKYREERRLLSTGYSHILNDPQPPTPPVPISDSFDNFLTWKLGPPSSRINHVLNSTVLELISDREVADLVKLVSTQALSNYNRSYAQGLVTFGELRKTLQLIRNPLQALIQYLKKPYRYTTNKTVHLKGGGVKVTRISKVVDPVKTIIPLGNALSSQYLAWYYGMKPILRDIESAKKAFEKATVIRHRTGAEDVRSKTRTLTRDLHLGSALVSSKYTETLDESVKVTAGLVFQPSELTYADSFGFSASAVPAALFELMPWSFLTSWVSNLSTWVNTLAKTFSRDIRCSWITVETNVRCERKSHSYVTAPTWHTLGSSDGDLYLMKHKHRYPANLVDERGIVLSFDKEIPALAAASLLIQKLTSRKT